MINYKHFVAFIQFLWLLQYTPFNNVRHNIQIKKNNNEKNGKSICLKSILKISSFYLVPMWFYIWYGNTHTHTHTHTHTLKGFFFGNMSDFCCRVSRRFLHYFIFKSSNKECLVKIVKIILNDGMLVWLRDWLIKKVIWVWMVYKHLFKS